MTVNKFKANQISKLPRAFYRKIFLLSLVDDLLGPIVVTNCRERIGLECSTTLTTLGHYNPGINMLTDPRGIRGDFPKILHDFSREEIRGGVD